MKLYLVRHGETDWNREGRMQGRKEVDINLFGLRQAHLCAKRLKHIPFDCAYTSPQSRAIQTAEIITRNHNLTLNKHPNLQEIHLGSWEGLTWSDVKKKHRGLMDDMNREKKMANIHGGETYEDVIDRAMGFIDDIEETDLKNVLVVTHGGVIKSMVTHILGLSIEKRSNFHITNTSVSVLERDKAGKWKVLTMNDHSHLEELMFD